MSSDYLKIIKKGRIDELEWLRIDFPSPWDIWPSVANTHRAFRNRVCLDPKIKSQLQALLDITTISCMRQFSRIPQFKPKTRVIAVLGISEANKRKDIENVVKGVVDWCLVRSGIIDDDHQIWPIPFPLFWFQQISSNGGYIQISKFRDTE